MVNPVNWQLSGSEQPTLFNEPQDPLKISIIMSDVEPVMFKISKL
jgi:hypothetical protein